MSWLSGIVDSVSSFFDSGAGTVVKAVAGAAADSFEGSRDRQATSSGRGTLIQRPSAKYNPTERITESKESRAAPVVDARATQDEWMQMFKRHWDEAGN